MVTKANDKKSESNFKKLPVKGNLNFLLGVSWGVLVLLIFTVLFAILKKDIIYPNADVIQAFLPVDYFHLFVAVPLLVISLFLTHKGNLAGLLCWPGLLLYIFYSFVTNLVGVPFGVLFLPYLLLVVLSGYTIFGIALSIDFNRAAERISGRVPNKIGGGVLFGLTAIFVINAFSQIVTALINNETAGAMQIMLWTADLATISPMCLIGGVLLFRRKSAGLAAGPGLFLAYALLFLGLLPVMVFQANYSGMNIDWIGLGMMAIFGAACLVFLVIFLRVIDQKR